MSSGIDLTIPISPNLAPKVVIMGIGGAGGNAVNNIICRSQLGADCVVVNTDVKSLEYCKAERKLQIGVELTKGLGAGSLPEIGRGAAEESLSEISECISDANLLFIAAGMGGGTGTGASAVIARIAREMGILTIAFVTKPFDFEGMQRLKVADQGIEDLRKYVDAYVVIPNQNLFRVVNEKTTFSDAFKLSDDVLYSGIRAITDLMSMSGLINLDFADIKSVISDMGKAIMGTAESEGDNRAVKAAENAIFNPLLDNVSMKGASGVLINISGGSDMTLFEVDAAVTRIREEVVDDASVVFGSTFSEELDGRIRVSVIATGIDKKKKSNSSTHIAENDDIVLNKDSDPALDQEESLEDGVLGDVLKNARVSFNKILSDAKSKDSSQKDEMSEEIDIPAFLRRKKK